MDAQAMLIAAVAALWGALFMLGKELRAMWLRALDDCKEVIKNREDRIAALEAAALTAMQAKDAELSEYRKLVIVQYGSDRRASQETQR